MAPRGFSGPPTAWMDLTPETPALDFPVGKGQSRLQSLAHSQHLLLPAAQL